MVSFRDGISLVLRGTLSTGASVILVWTFWCRQGFNRDRLSLLASSDAAENIVEASSVLSQEAGWSAIGFVDSSESADYGLGCRLV